MSIIRFIVPGVLIGGLTVVAYRQWQPEPAVRMSKAPLAVGSPGGPSTSRADLAAAIATLEARLAAEPRDPTAAARLSEALVRQARVTSNPGLAVRAEEALRAALAHDPGHYEATRMLGTVLLSQHRFRDAIASASRAMQMEPKDAWNHGVAGDAHLELGEYDEAFAAFDRMMAARPSAAAYARVSYAREISGDLDGALRLMQMALDATSAHDPEALAWHRVQIGDLHVQRGALADADREYRHAAFSFPGHPLAVAGTARVLEARGDAAGALALYEGLMARGPTPELAARIGELHLRLGRAEQAERHFALAENGWRYDTPEPAHLARFLATHDRHVAEALAVAERAAASRRDIYTMDALAWAAFKAGRMDLALRASREARRTGTRDPMILEHARAIDAKAAGGGAAGTGRAG